MENESRTKKTSRNIIYAIFSQFIKLILSFISRIIFVKQLGASFLGLQSIFSNILSVLSLTDLGMTTAMMYSLYKPLSDGDEEKVNQYIFYFRRVYNIIALIVGVLGILLIPFIKYIVNLPTDIPNLYTYYILFLINTVISYLFIYKTTLLSADQKMYIINKYDMIFQIILFISQTLLLLLTKNFALFLICNILCTFFSNLLKVKETEKIYKYLGKKTNNKLSKDDRRALFANLKSLFLYKFGSVIQSNTDNILISLFVGTISVGYYSNYSLIITSITSFITIIFTALKSSLGNYVVKNDIKSQLKMFNILEIYNFWIVGFCSICFINLIPDFIKICFGDEYLLSNGVLLCAVLNFYVTNVRQTIWAYRETTGLFNKTKYITLITSIINLFLSILLGYYFGLIGIIGATVISKLVYALWKEPKILFEEYFKTNEYNYIYKYIKRLLLIGLIGAITTFACTVINVNNIYIIFTIKCLICAVIPVVFLILIYRNSDAMSFLKNNVFKKVWVKLNERLSKNR